LDYAILVISGADGIQSHTQTLWRLLVKYKIPVFIFINKMDQLGTDETHIIEQLRKTFSDGCIQFLKASGEDEQDKADFYEAVALCDEHLLSEYLENGCVDDNLIRTYIQKRKIFPCYFGSALKLQGIDSLLNGISKYTKTPTYGDDFGALVYKISRDEQNNRLTHLKVTGGVLKVRDMVGDHQDKVNQIRIYSGEKYEAVNEAVAGTICAVTGLNDTYPGQGLGIQQSSSLPVLEPVLTYGVVLPKECDATQMLGKLNLLMEEEPELHVLWNPKLQEIQVQIMGEVQLEVIKHLVKERFGLDISFSTGNIVYKETILNTVEGVGHFEPLKHYAEVHLLMEPAERGSGVTIESNCSEDMLDKNWQRLILTHLHEKIYQGVLTGSEITDIKITLAAGKAHQKHTEGGDFRQAVYRAVRQGLMQAESVLLEPFYAYELTIPESMVGRAMMDMERMCGTFEIRERSLGTATITGQVPVATIRDYYLEVVAYTKGTGRLSTTFCGYYPCHNAEEVMEKIHYEPLQDLENTPNSVFCAHGAGFVVPWNQVQDYMHLDSILQPNGDALEESYDVKNQPGSSYDASEWIDPEEVDAILRQTYYANQRDSSVKRPWKKTMSGSKLKSLMPVSASGTTSYAAKKQTEPKEKYLLVDGYNVIFAWKELKELADRTIDGARGRLMDILCNYQGMKQCQLIVVFDAYRVKGHDTEILDYHNIHVVYTKEAETADQYIEKFAHQHGRSHDVTVVTSDGLEQIIIIGQGCNLISSREFEKEVEATSHALRQDFLDKQTKQRNSLMEALPEQAAEQIRNLKGRD
jgi:translation elongation factor EF-G/predicted RNA-binding protein with PIN domain